jgi:hypothetical protein
VTIEQLRMEFFEAEPVRYAAARMPLVFGRQDAYIGGARTGYQGYSSQFRQNRLAPTSVEARHAKYVMAGPDPAISCSTMPRGMVV